MQQVALFTIGWSEYYKGGPIFAQHKYVQENGYGHELYNFSKYHGNYYGYVRPQGTSKPNPPTKNNWIVFFISKENGTGPLKLVGWYENAEFEETSKKRPEYTKIEDFPRDQNGREFTYLVKSPKATLLKEEDRSLIIKSKHIGSSSIYYLDGDDSWRKEIKQLLLGFKNKFTERVSKPFKLKGGDKDIEEFAINFVIKDLKKQKYEVRDVQLDKCGYDLIATKGTDQLLVEVKGKAFDGDNIILTKNEYQFAIDKIHNWHLFIVSNISNGKVELSKYSSIDTRELFTAIPLSYSLSKIK